MESPNVFGLVLEDIAGEVVIAIISWLGAWTIWGRKAKSRMLKDSMEYWKQFDADIRDRFEYCALPNMFDYKDLQGKPGDLGNIIKVKDGFKDNFSAYLSLLRPYYKMAFEWSEHKLDIKRIDKECGDKLLHILRIGIIERCKRNPETYYKLNDLNRLIDCICDYREYKNKNIIVRFLYRFNRKCKC